MCYGHPLGLLLGIPLYGGHPLHPILRCYDFNLIDGAQPVDGGNGDACRSGSNGNHPVNTGFIPLLQADDGLIIAEDVQTVVVHILRGKLDREARFISQGQAVAAQGGHQAVRHGRLLRAIHAGIAVRDVVGIDRRRQVNILRRVNAEIDIVGRHQIAGGGLELLQDTEDNILPGIFQREKLGVDADGLALVGQLHIVLFITRHIAVYRAPFLQVVFAQGQLPADGHAGSVGRQRLDELPGAVPLGSLWCHNILAGIQVKLHSLAQGQQLPQGAQRRHAQQSGILLRAHKHIADLLQDNAALLGGIRLENGQVQDHVGVANIGFFNGERIRSHLQNIPLRGQHLIKEVIPVDQGVIEGKASALVRLELVNGFPGRVVDGLVNPVSVTLVLFRIQCNGGGIKIVGNRDGSLEIVHPIG